MRRHDIVKGGATTVVASAATEASAGLAVTLNAAGLDPRTVAEYVGAARSSRRAVIADRSHNATGTHACAWRKGRDAGWPAGMSVQAIVHPPREGARQ
ncbi:hypothetical protein KDW11_05885 [Burkholderia multivorans]|nr:hypothetical protein [Burkholderia multivorans]MBR8450818.1 hypothetical protein [Burkholderia multivorans]